VKQLEGGESIDVWTSRPSPPAPGLPGPRTARRPLQRYQGHLEREQQKVKELLERLADPQEQPQSV